MATVSAVTASAAAASAGDVLPTFSVDKLADKAASPLLVKDEERLTTRFLLHEIVAAAGEDEAEDADPIAGADAGGVVEAPAPPASDAPPAGSAEGARDAPIDDASLALHRHGSSRLRSFMDERMPASRFRTAPVLRAGQSSTLAPERSAAGEPLPEQ